MEKRLYLCNIIIIFVFCNLNYLIMMKKILKLFICCAISFGFAQNNTLLNVKIDGMHCAGGCAKMIENSLNQNDGINPKSNSFHFDLYQKDLLLSYP